MHVCSIITEWGGSCERGLACFGALKTLTMGRWAGNDPYGIHGLKVIYECFSETSIGAVHGKMAMGNLQCFGARKLRPKREAPKHVTLSSAEKQR